MRFYGLLPTTPDHRDYFLRAPRPYAGEFVDLSGGFTQVYDQGELGSCVSNGSAACVDFARKKQGLDPLLPSRLFIYYQGRVRGKYPLNQDTGLQIRDGANVLGNDGAPPETDWPYHIQDFTKKPPAQAYADGLENQALKYAQVDPDGIDAAIASGYPVLQGFDVYSSFESTRVAQTGIVPLPKNNEQLLGGHCTVICSTPKDGSEIYNGIPGMLYRKHLNSWGPEWGLGGYYWAPVTYTTAYASDFWVITSMEDSHVTPPQPPKDPDASFAAILKPWIGRPHLSVTGAKKVSTAAKLWISAKGL